MSSRKPGCFDVQRVLPWRERQRLQLPAVAGLLTLQAGGACDVCRRTVETSRRGASAHGTRRVGPRPHAGGHRSAGRAPATDRTRLERLGPTTRRLLTIAAVIGREFRLSVIEGLVDVGEDDVLDAMDEALAAGVVAEEPGVPGSFSFTHTLIREALYTSVTAARRVRLHHRIACALEQESSPFASRLGELAYHFAVGRLQERREGSRLCHPGRRS